MRQGQGVLLLLQLSGTVGQCKTTASVTLIGPRMTSATTADLAPRTMVASTARRSELTRRTQSDTWSETVVVKTNIVDQFVGRTLSDLVSPGRLATQSTGGGDREVCES